MYLTPTPPAIERRSSAYSSAAFTHIGVLVPAHQAAIGLTQDSRHLDQAEAREDAKSLVPPSSGPTQVGTTPSIAFRAMVELDGTASALEVGL